MTIFLPYPEVIFEAVFPFPTMVNSLSFNLYEADKDSNFTGASL